MNYWEYVVKTVELMSNKDLDNFIYSSNKKRNINTVLNNEVGNTLYCSGIGGVIND